MKGATDFRPWCHQYAEVPEYQRSSQFHFHHSQTHANATPWAIAKRHMVKRPMASLFLGAESAQKLVRNMQWALQVEYAMKIVISYKWKHGMVNVQS